MLCIFGSSVQKVIGRLPIVQVRSEPFADRQSNLPQSLPPDAGKGLTDFRDGCSSFRSEATVASTSGKHMQETWLLLEYCDKGSLQVSHMSFSQGSAGGNTFCIWHLEALCLLIF